VDCGPARLDPESLDDTISSTLHAEYATVQAVSINRGGFMESEKLIHDLIVERLRKSFPDNTRR
jgi:hypothetical protein